MSITLGINLYTPNPLNSKDGIIVETVFEARQGCDLTHNGKPRNVLSDNNKDMM